MNKIRNWVRAVCAAVCITGITGTLLAQEPTPITVQLTTATPLPVLGSSPLIATLSPTETPLGGAQLEALTEVNVRAEASTDADRLGLIVPGEKYQILGRYFRWLQFRYPNSPSGTGWVYDELVEISGDTTLIPDLSVAPPTADPIAAASTETAAAILSVPGGDMTATAGARVLEGPESIEAGASVLGENQLNPQGEQRLPTFTPAPNVGELVAQSAIIPTNTTEPQFLNLTREAGGFPPILPIAALVGFGILGLAISFTRR